MTPEQKNLARHALGLPNKNKCTFRNRFYSSKDNPEWSGMVEAGEAKVAPVKSDMIADYAVFWLTRIGAVRALEPGERLDREDFPTEAA